MSSEGSSNLVSTRAAEPSGSDRWLALDVFRALAVLWMIQGHTFTALLSPGLYRGAWVQPYSLLHGLTAPMFLIGAGLSYGLVMFGGTAGDRSGRIVRRALQLLAIGTLLQLPRTTLIEVFARQELFARSFQPGALQLVASGLLLAEALRRVCRTRRAFALASAATALAIALAAPWLWKLHLSEMIALGGWFDGQAGSQFPPIPWLCFFFVGAALAAGFGRRLWLQEAPGAGAMAIWGSAGLACSAVCYALFLAGVRLSWLYGAHSFWFCNPLFVMFRVGLALAWLGLLTANQSRLVRAFAALPKLARVIRSLARHSLVAYVAHLMLLYGTPWNAGLARAGASFGWLETCGALGCVLCLTGVATLGWDDWQARGGVLVRLSAWRAQRASDELRS